MFAVIAALLLGACSSGGDDDAADDTTTTEADGDPTETTDGDEGDETTTTDGDTTETTEGDSGGSVDVGGDGQAYVDAMIASMQEDSDFPMSDQQAECFSSRFVRTIGVDRLQAAGVTPEMMAGGDETMEFTELELSEAEGNELYDHFGACGIDMRAMLIESFAEDADITPEMQTCFEGALTEENVRAFMVVAMTQGDEALETDPAASAMMSGLMGCAFMGMEDMGE